MSWTQTNSSISTLRQFAQQEDSQGAEVEVCELCSEQIPPEHRHLLHMDSREVVCACNACALLFEDDRASQFAKSEYKLIPRDAYALPDLQIDAVQWNRLSLPINLAFFVYRTSGDDASAEDGEARHDDTDVTALYPSPAGATESLLSLDAWEVLTDEHPALEEMEPDVQALLANRVDEHEAYYLAPIDICYRLVGLIRLHWRGFSGGEEVWTEIENFFDELDQQSRSWTGPHA